MKKTFVIHARQQDKTEAARQAGLISVCPWCKTNAHVQTGSMLKTFYCRKCKREFESVDDGDITYGPPDRRLRREERTAKQQSAKR